MRYFTILFVLVVLAGCKSASEKAKKRSSDWAILAEAKPMAQVGGYYKVKGNMTRFYPNLPTFTDVLSDKYLGRGHVVQLLNPDALDGWARVKNEDLEMGYVRFDALKIVPEDKQPSPFKRDRDEELDRRMKGR